MSDLVAQSAHALARLIQAGEVSSREVVAAHLERIERLNPKLNAITHLDAEGALEQAAQADEARANGRPLGRLHGVPLTVKSSFDVRGLRAECGSRFREGYRAERDATLVARLRREGAVFLGTTNTPDMLMAYETDNYLYGRTNSPLDPARTPGGSSGGEAAAIAGGLSPAGFGSDGGGSVRVPCHFCGLFGLKPTPGVIPRTGHWPACLGPSAFLGLAGPMARTATDLQLLLEITSGPERHDPSAAPVSVASPTDEELAGVTIGVLEEVEGFPVTPETRAAVRRAADALEQQGFRTQTVKLPDFAAARDVWEVLFSVAGFTLTAPLIAGREDDLHPLSRGLFASRAVAEAMTYPEFLNAWVERDRVRVRLLEAFERCRVILCPVAAIPAPLHGEREWDITGQVVRYPGVFAYSQVFNLTSQPAATAPAGRTAEGLPIGVQIVGRPFEDSWTISVAERIERLLGSSPISG